jgi:hypothetical protein
VAHSGAVADDAKVGWDAGQKLFVIEGKHAGSEVEVVKATKLQCKVKLQNGQQATLQKAALAPEMPVVEPPQKQLKTDRAEAARKLLTDDDDVD